MSPSENIFRQIRMLVTDADGTLIGRRPEFEQYRAFRARINDLRTTYGANWVVCTGRSLMGYKRLFRAMNAFGISPDYVITHHAFIYECRSWGHLPHWIWNLRVHWLQWKDDIALRRALPKLKKAVLSRNPFARLLYSSKDRLAFRFDDEGAANFGAEILRAEARPYQYLQVFQMPGEVDVRVIPFTKGLAVKELARHLGISNRQILVVGDGHNDISMMEMDPPCHTACPANAVAEVIEAVHRTHGHIASEKNLGGVMEAMNAYEKGEINDKLPEDWRGFDLPSERRPQSTGMRSGVGTALILLMVVYTTLLVLSSFCHFPGRRIILKPYNKMMESIQRLIECKVTQNSGYNLENGAD
ncbi:MAG: HAD family hydrolase [bacterium]